jgi:hypothetical protein
MKKPHSLTLVLLFFTLSIFSQSIERQLIGVAGENDSGKQILLNWTLGESFTFYDVTLLGDYKEGFLQPHDLLQELDKTEPDNNHNFSGDFSAEVFPNPFSGTFTFQINYEQESDAQLTILDYSGKFLMKKTFPAGSLKMEWTMNDYPAGLYFLQFTDNSRITRHSFKLLKL